jgi:hypothetical protein
MLSPNDASRFFLIDYGIARPYHTGTPSHYKPVEENRHIVGTLTWASLNSHNGYGRRPFLHDRQVFQVNSLIRLSDLSRRDDLESLAYTLLFLLRGSLPWQRASLESSTILARMAQVREKKRSWTGARLGEGFPDAFGQLLDHARALEFDEKPDYARFHSHFDDLLHRSSIEHEVPTEQSIASRGSSNCEINYAIPPPSLHFRLQRVQLRQI